jgi:small-conductance mechanosensitive channel
MVVTRTPAPTAAPDVIDQGVNKVASATGLGTTHFLGLYVADWMNLGVSFFIVLAGYLIGTWLIRRGLPMVARRTPTEFDSRLLDAIGPNLRWLVVVFALHFTTERLTFLGAGLKVLLTDVYFVLGLGISLRIVWMLIDLSNDWYREHVAAEMRLEDIDPALILMVRMGRVTVVVVGAFILLSHFGINVTAIAAVLGIGGLAISLAARDTIADAIAGFIILVDRPFRIGDRIEIQDIGTWGDVANIGLRTTRVHTRDNRMVIVPNSLISANQVINYTYPDPRYRLETHVGITYDTNLETARSIIADTVRQVEGVLPDKPVEALYIEMGDSAMIFRVRWWIESYVDTRPMFDQVHTALQHALNKAGIEFPYPSRTLNFRVDGEKSERLSQSLGERDQTS